MSVQKLINKFSKENELIGEVRGGKQSILFFNNH